MESKSTLSYNELNNDIYYTVLLHTDSKDVDKLCQVNKQMSSICNNHFWKNKILIDYPFVQLNSTNYKKEYHRLTYLYALVQNVLKVIELYAEDHMLAQIGFLNNKKGYIKLSKTYWLPEKIKNQIKDRMIIVIGDNEYYINGIRTDKETIINTFWLSMYHDHVDITDLHGRSFLYDNVKDKKILKY